MVSSQSQDGLVTALPRVLYYFPGAKESCVIFEARDIRDLYHERLYGSDCEFRAPIRCGIDLRLLDSVRNQRDALPRDTHFIGKKVYACCRIGDKPPILPERKLLNTPNVIAAGVPFAPDAQLDTGEAMSQAGDDVGPSGERQEDIDASPPEFADNWQATLYPPKTRMGEAENAGWYTSGFELRGIITCVPMRMKKRPDLGIQTIFLA